MVLQLLFPKVILGPNKHTLKHTQTRLKLDVSSGDVQKDRGKANKPCIVSCSWSEKCSLAEAESRGVGITGGLDYHQPRRAISSDIIDFDIGVKNG